MSDNRTTTVKDALGRTLTVRRFSVSERMRFYKLIPRGAQENAVWLTTALVIASVIQVDAVPCKPLATEGDLEQRGDVLGDEGIEAATVALSGLLPSKTNEELLAKAGE